MLVESDKLACILDHLRKEPVLAVDLETTSLLPARGRLFAVVIATPTQEFYFNFNPYFPDNTPLPFEALSQFLPLFADPERLWVGHNIKFDLGFLKKEGLEPAGPVWCTQVMARVQRNDHLRYSLDECAKRLGHAKDDQVKKYADKHRLFDWVEIPGKKGRTKDYHFERIPLEIMLPYACKDARLAFTLYLDQQQTFQAWDQSPKPISPLVKLEQATTKVIVGMESRGIRVDRLYCMRAAEYEKDRIAKAKEAFHDFTRFYLIDSAKELKPIFDRHGLPYGMTEKGNPSFDSETLSKLDHPLPKILLEYRDAQKRLGTYFSSFLYYSQWDGRIHTSFNAGGTGTGRLSSNSPNLQNLSDEEEESPYPIRRAFLPEEGEILASLDYQAMEYRLMLDYAGQMDVIEAVKAGKDVHQACADLMGVPRRAAKTINFMLLYGGGAQKLADALGVPLAEAQQLKQRYFSALPKIREFIRNAMLMCEVRGYLYNRYGRRSFFPDKKWAYKGPNYIIQGGCADLMRRAFVDISQKFPDVKMLLQIHDELVFSLRPDQLDLLPGIQQTMVNAYQPTQLPMACSAHVGDTLYDLEPVSVEEARNDLPRTGTEGS
jgi:DNA polymerase I